MDANLFGNALTGNALEAIRLQSGNVGSESVCRLMCIHMRLKSFGGEAWIVPVAASTAYRFTACTYSKTRIQSLNG